MAKKPAKQRTQNDQFYEAMPGAWYDHPFYAAPSSDYKEEEYYDEESRLSEHESVSSEEARGKMVRYGVALAVLFTLQIILFVLLLRSTANLG